MSLPFQNNSKTYLRAPVLPLPSLLITVPGCLPAFHALFRLRSPFLRTENTLYFFIPQHLLEHWRKKSIPLAWELLRQRELTFAPVLKVATIKYFRIKRPGNGIMDN